MADIALRGNRLTAAKGGRASLRFGGGRTNLLEQLGRVEGERSNPNRRAEISRVHGELNRGYKDGGRIGYKFGSEKGSDWKKGKFGKKTIAAMKKHDFPAGGPHQSLEGKKAALQHATIRAGERKRDKKAEGGRIGFRKGGTDKKWMQKVSASIKKRGTKGKCTPITKPGCTGRAKALAKTFKKIAAKNKKA